MVLWIVFLAIFVTSMMVELVLSKKAHDVSPKEAGMRSAIWAGLALLFGVGIYFNLGGHYPDPILAQQRGFEYVTGYLIELALSVDNLFVFLMLFSAFEVAPMNRQRVLTWGILGAIIMRGIMIFVGAALFHQFEWLMYVFGAFLIYTGVKMAIPHEEKNSDISENKLLRFLKRFIPMTDHYHGEKFATTVKGVWKATPLLMVLLMVEATDVMFALDSIPAIFAVTNDTFVVLTSNLFAIMGLRSLYFLLQGMMNKFRFLNYGLAVVLIFIGFKMVALYWEVHIAIRYSLSFVIGTLVISILLSFLIPAKENHVNE